MLVGEALGEDEETKEEYFVGKAGGLLNKLLRDVGLIRSALHITNVVKIRPPDNKLARLGELGLSLEDFLPLLYEEIEQVCPSYILAIGATALEALTNETGITKWRGSALKYKHNDSIIILPTLHPAYLQRGQMHLYPYVRNDIARLANLAYGIESPDEDFVQIIDPTFNQAISALDEITETSSATCIDIETIAGQRITCIGFSFSSNKAICIPFRHEGLKLRWMEHEQIMLLRAMQRLYAQPGLLKIGQNFHYDMHFLLPLLGFPREPIFDTMYAHSLIHPDAPHDLGFLTAAYTRMTYHKDEFKDWAEKSLPHDQTLWEYNIKDVIATHRVYQSLRKDLISYGLYDFFTGYIMPFRRLLFEMEWRGLNVDHTLRDEWTSFVENEELPIAQDIVNKLTGRELNPNSSKQVGEYLTLLGLPVPRTEAGNFTVKEEVLEDLISRFPQHRALLKQILCTRVLKAKDLGTYLRAPLSADGRLRCSYGTTVTGRLSSKANLSGEGGNLQNFPKQFREFIIPEIGHAFVESDLSQAEARVMAWLMKSDKLKDVFKQGKKIHKVVGSWIYNKPEDSLTPDEYLIAKKTVHGSNYRMGVNKFARIIGQTVAEAKVIQGKYFTIVPELLAYHQEIQHLIDTERKLTTPYGRSRIFTGRLDDETYRSGYAQIPQSTVVDTINIGLLGLWLIKPPDILIITQTHDSALFSLPIERVQWWTPYIRAHLETLRELTIKGDKLTIPVDIEKPKENWYGK
uniref:Putative DNA polymerase n=1 Tax=viral metagenome TaxID=1070528 RepID=A0A6M3ILU2_9ZZZZ